MGKKKIIIIGEEQTPKKKEGKKKTKKEMVVETKPVKKEEVEVKEVEEKEAKEKIEKEEKKTERKPKTRSKKYLSVKSKIDSNKVYPLKEAVVLVKKTSISNFVGNLEAHIVVKQTGSIGELTLPHFKGKEKKVVVANEKIIAQIEKGKIDFDILLASPKIMPKLIPLAKVLGPKGLMPNPKNGTLIENPEKAKAKFSQQGLKLKTEKKAPVVHVVLGKLDQTDKELIANVEALIKTINSNQIKKLVLKATMGPGIKIKL